MARKSPVARRRSRSPRKHSPRKHSPRKHSPRKHSPRRHSPRKHSPRKSVSTATLMKRITKARMILQKMIDSNSGDLRRTAKRRSNIKNTAQWNAWKKNTSRSDLQLIGPDPKGKFQYFDAKRGERKSPVAKRRSAKRKSPKRKSPKSRRSPKAIRR